MIDIDKISTSLKQAPNQIWFSENEDQVSFPSEGHKECFAIEDYSFWFKHRNNCIISATKQFPPANNGTIFDIGGGNGFVALGLKKAGFDVALIEPGIEGAINAKLRDIDTVICATTNTAKILPRSLPAIGLFDVIEHIEDDLAFLSSIREIVKDDGYIYITVPSHSILWSHEDETAGHFRRYSINSICKVLNTAGFKIEYSTYFFQFLPIPIFLFRALPFRLGLFKSTKSSHNKDHKIKGNKLTMFINKILGTEIKNIDNKKIMKFGGSCLIVAKAN